MAYTDVVDVITLPCRVCCRHRSPSSSRTTISTVSFGQLMEYEISKKLSSSLVRAAVNAFPDLPSSFLVTLITGIHVECEEELSPEDEAAAVATAATAKLVVSPKCPVCNIRTCCFVVAGADVVTNGDDVKHLLQTGLHPMCEMLRSPLL